MSRPTRPAIAVLGVCAVAAPVAVAQGEPVKLTGEQTVIALTGPAVETLTSNGVTVAAVAPATRDGASVTFPVTGGRLNAKLTKGFVRHAGGVTFTKAGKSLTVRRPLAVVTRRAKFLAVRRKDRLVRVFRLRNVTKETSGTTVTVTADLRVTRLLARRLNRHLGTTVAAGAKAGTATSTLPY